MDTIGDRLLNNELYWKDEGVPISDGTENSQLSQEDFFALLTEQLSMQDPTKPVDNDQMVSQMTSFTMADSLSQLNSKFDEFASSMNSNQALQATSLIGQTVLVNSNTSSTWQDGTVTGGIIAEAPVDDMRIQIVDEYGSVVREFEAGSQDAGVIPFSWDGTDNDGNLLPRGKYNIQATGTVDGLNTELDVQMSAQVTGTAITTRDVQDMVITIEDQAGQVIRTMNVGSAQAGNIEFGWDGTDNEGRIMPPGEYTINIEGKVNGQTEALQFGVNRRVNSVSLAGSGTEGVILNLAGDESIRLSDIINIGN
ncbi:MAG: FlgD immunoglobulin-like domain containing protein [Aestuariibacter sp.]